VSITLLMPGTVSEGLGDVGREHDTLAMMVAKTRCCCSTDNRANQRRISTAAAGIRAGAR